MRTLHIKAFFLVDTTGQIIDVVQHVIFTHDAEKHAISVLEIYEEGELLKNLRAKNETRYKMSS